MPPCVKLSLEVNVSLNTAACFHYMWRNAPRVPGKRRDVMQFTTCARSLLSKPAGYLLGRRWVSPPPAEASSRVCGGEGCRVGEDSSLWPLSAAGRRQHLSTGRQVARHSPLPRGSRALRTERAATAALPPQLPGLPSPSRRPLCLRPAPARSTRRAVRNRWCGNLVRPRLWWSGRTAPEVTADWEKQHHHSPSVLPYFMRTCPLFSVFWMCLYKTRGSPSSSGYAFYFALTIAIF